MSHRFPMNPYASQLRDSGLRWCITHEAEVFADKDDCLGAVRHLLRFDPKPCDVRRLLVGPDPETGTP